MQKEEARIAAHVCGDGWLYNYLEKNSLQIVHGRRYRRERRRYVIGYCNNEQILRNQFEKDMWKIFNVKPIRVKTEVRFKSKRVYDKITEWGGGKSREWYIGKEIFKANKECKREWIKAFFDDESTVTEYKSIRVKIVNLNGLKQLKRLLADVNIKSHITGENIDHTWYLSINKPDSIKYYKNIGFYHPSKNNKMKKLSR
jgi:hypothetical protein